MKLKLNRKKHYGKSGTILVVVPKQILPKEVTAIRYLGTPPTGYCVCPGCNCTFEREYQAYCDRCGQKLAWNLFNQNKVTLIKRIPCTVKKKEEKTQALKKHEAFVL